MSINKKTLSRFRMFAVLTLATVVAGCNKNSGSSAPNSSAEQSSSSSSSETTYFINRPDFTPEYLKYELSPSPSGINMGYYNGIYSRGFSWLTDATVTDTELYLVQSDKGEAADFSNAEVINGTVIEATIAKNGTLTTKDGSLPSKKGSGGDYELNVNSHKVHVENLEKGKAYSYKIGSEAGYAYGAFIVEKEEVKTITAIQMSDAQTKDPNKLNVWRNTFTKAVDTAGNDLDMVLYNGDQFDQNMGKAQSSDQYKPNRLLMYSKAYDVISDYKASIPYMSSSGNHEPSAAYSQYLMSDYTYAGFNEDGCYYSYDYDFAHFVVLNTNTIDDEQLNWLKSDLDTASEAKWKVVMLHIAPYSTGDHSNKAENQTLIEKLTPIFSSKHVDLVLQAHDHTYNKTLPYKWDAAGYTQTNNDTSVVNYDVVTETVDNVTYDKNPNGTYYITTGAAGHRCGAAEEDGIWSEVVKDGDQVKGLNPSKTFLDNKYKNAYGVLTQSNQYEPYTFGSYTSSQNYQAGNPATGNVNAQMFGVLTMSENTLSYHSYTVNNDTVKLFDTLDVLKA